MSLFKARVLNFPTILFLTVLLCLPALFSGLLGDDYIHYALLSPDIAIPKAHDWSLFGLFSWIDADPARNKVLMDLGVIPWWTDASMRYEFWRPLAELSHWIDHRFWHHSPLLMHLHSLLWYLGLGWALFRLYQRVGMTMPAVLLGLAVFMLDSTHGLTLSWIANRNAIMAALFGVLCLLDFMAWREHNSPGALIFSLVWLMASLFSGEVGVSTACYLGAYALSLDRKGPAKGLLALWPYALLCIVWWGLYRAGHFGADNSEVNYIDPVANPIMFGKMVLERAPVLMFSEFGIVPAEIYGFSGHPMPLYISVALLFILMVGWLLYPLLRTSSVARFWALGTCLALAPIATTVPSDRNLLMVGIGASPLLGMLFQQFREQLIGGQLTQQRLRRYGIRVLVAIHLVLSPLLLPLTSDGPQIWSKLMGLNLAEKIPVASPRESDLVFGLPMPIALGANPMRFAKGLPIPTTFWLISSLKQNFTLTRIDADTLRVTSKAGMIDAIEGVLRNLKKHPLPPHYRVSLTGLTLTVTKLNSKGHPTELELRFTPDRLADTHIISWTGKAFERREIPPIGGQLVLNLAPHQQTLDVAGR